VLHSLDAHIISLSDSPRRKVCRERLTIKGYNPIFHDAFDARNVKQKELDLVFDIDLFKDVFDYRVGSEVIGCTLSHHNLYKDLLKLKKTSDYHLIVEDDCIPIATSDEVKGIIDAVKNTPFDVLILGYSKTDENEYKIINKMNPFKKIYISRKYNIGIRYKETSCGAVAYVVSSDFLKKITTTILKPYYVADEWSFFKNKLKTLILHVKPLCFLEDYKNMDSSLEKNRIIVNKKQKRLPFFIRPIWRQVYSFFVRILFFIELFFRNKKN
jgi:glycosyl transferase, family 25